MTAAEPSYIYEEPSSLRVADWERFTAQMQAEVDRYPERGEARDTLAFAQRMLRDLRADPFPGEASGR